MARYCIEKIDPDMPAPANVHGRRHTMSVPDLPEEMDGVDVITDWLVNNPDFPPTLVSSIIGLVICFTARKKPQ